VPHATINQESHFKAPQLQSKTFIAPEFKACDDGSCHFMSAAFSPSIETAMTLGRRAISGEDLDSLLAHLLESISKQLHIELSSFLELLPDGRAIFQAGRGWNEGVVGHATVEMCGNSATGHVIRTLTPLAISDVRTENRFAVSSLHRQHNVLSNLLVPVYGHDRPLGVLGASSLKPRVFSADEIAWLQVLANILSARLERKWLRPGENDQKLMRAEQMMALGQVAAGVAHELRNPLTSIKGLIQVNLRELEARGLPATDLMVIEHEIRRMEKTLQTFLDFARPPRPDRRCQDIGSIVEPVLALIRGRAQKQSVSLRFLRSETAVDAEVDSDQIEQLLLNLVLNALDAMPHGGSLDVELRPARDGFLEIYVRDTGSGIAPHVVTKLFETFVSSKETGVGLGLSLSRRIAEDHGGTLTGYNLPVAGACFLLRLPAAEDYTPRGLK
jgi:signal transduction histidine kinase